ncbi:MAG: hypothetical protein K9G67_07120 [Bacteroidales bacterium]|nr:hypothetical protein [Bacteroidales bacterium]MCF8345073.1 hypothetical protein [Bacteroidales bacterium]MCF8350988.1 hypothetical protein [Bacteroidales bacterium]MCF8376112.1 hypothetical protein [Bacteroidales bacterium]MCF8401425.1 hypothetical protein [Bacteroidales bacterium]
MESKSLKNILLAIAVGIWLLVFQNLGIIPQLRPTTVQADSAMHVTGSVRVDDVVYIKGEVDANIKSINGYAKFYKDPRTDQYYVLPVTDPYE